MSETQDDLAAAEAMVGRTRASDRITAEAVRTFMNAQPDRTGDVQAIRFDTTKRSAGGSSGTVLFEADVTERSGAAMVEHLVMRYDLGGTFFFQYDLPLQFRIMRVLSDMGFPAPRVRWLDAEGAICGHPALIMDRIFAPPPTPTPLTNGPLMDADEPTRHAMILSAARTLARLHAMEFRDPEALALLERRGRGDDAIDREIDWLLAEVEHELGEKRRHGPKRDFYVDQYATIAEVAGWLRLHKPANRAPDFSHGDPNVTNFLFNGTDVVAVLDYELAHLGIGEADLAYMICCLAHYGIERPDVTGLPSEQELLHAYAQVRGSCRDWPFALVFAQWRVSAISAIGFSRLPAELEHLEARYWSFIRRRLRAFVRQAEGGPAVSSMDVRAFEGEA
jgi:aminoglycoside phosphotransferase (APT) family kinase protein